METQRVKITATDNIGRTESITLILPVNAAEQLIQAANNKDCYGQPDNQLKSELGNFEERFSCGLSSPLSKSQYKRLQDFDTLIYHKFYNYTLTIA